MATIIVCTIEGCGNPVLHRGWCSKHYQRWQRHGDPSKSLIDREQTGKPCKVDGCARKSGYKGYCELHYDRVKKYGNPFAFHPRHKKIQNWLQTNKNYKGNDCLIWPFTRSRDTGRGAATMNGNRSSAPRIMCILAHGKPPTRSHETAHSCGMGHIGCVNPRHLRWATRKENEADKIRHGTMRRGSNVNTSKLTKRQVRAIRRSNKSQKQLAIKYGVTPQAIRSILSRKSWAWLP